MYIGDGKGDICDKDFDDDSVPDLEDPCPENAGIYRVDFREYFTVVLDPQGESQIDPQWFILNQVKPSGRK